ncbi:uncharacterized protein TNCV_4081081 [Trichonephila clavipes]|nr:uncharacterized protein TNCV_4081081 [Trichonephila clavipes]
MEFLKNRKDFFFKDLRLDTALNERLCDAREFPDEIDIPANFELTQPRHRVRRRHVNFNYEAREDPIEDPTLKYKAEFYFFTLDKAINALESSFVSKMSLVAIIGAIRKLSSFTATNSSDDEPAWLVFSVFCSFTEGKSFRVKRFAFHVKRKKCMKLLRSSLSGL